MNVRRAAVLGTGVSVVVAVVAALVSALEIAVAALGVAILGVLVVQLLWTRQLGVVLTRIERKAERSQKQAALTRKIQRRLAQRLRRDRRDLRRDLSDVSGVVRATRRRMRGQRRRLERVDQRQVRLAAQLTDVRSTVQRTPGLTTELIRVYDRLVEHPHPMPELGGFALSPSSLLWILDHIATTPTRIVLECGSGSSTVWIATALQRRGGEGQVVALESSEHYAEVTRAELDRLGLAGRATVLHAPLIETELPDRDPQPWFDLSPLALDAPVDLLLVDGPPGRTAREARYPAFPMLADRLATGATVILDDTGRRDEDRIVESWCDETHHGRRLERTHSVDRSTVFVTTRA